MHESIIRNSSAPVNTQALTLVDYTVLGSHAKFKTDSKEPYKILRHEDQYTAPAALAALQEVLVGKHQLLQQQGDDADWDTVAWTTLDSKALLRAVADAAAALAAASNSDAGLEISKDVLQAAVATTGAAESGNDSSSSAGSWLEQLANVVLTVKASWEVLPEQQKQADYAPLELACTAGLLLARLHTHATTCTSSSGTCQQLALQLLRALCSSAVQQLLQESLAGHLFIFRWHEQPSAAADLDAAMLRKPLPAHPGSSSSEAPGQQQPISTSDGPCSASPGLPVPSPASSSGAPQLQLPRLLPADAVPAAHRAWCGCFLLPLLPAAGHWRGGQEVLLGWAAACCSAEQLGLPVDVKPASFMLALEGLWLFGQPPATYLQQATSTAPPNPTPATATAAASVEAGQLQLQRLWPSFLLRLLARLEAAVAPTAATAQPAASTDSTTTSPEPAPAAGGESTESIQAGVIAPAAPLLFGMLGEALQHLAFAWQQHPAAARAALIRATLADSQQPLVVQQRRSAALLGKGKPKAGEAVCGQLLMMTRQLALLLTELLQLERSTCGGLQRDGTVPVAESGAEAVWFSSLWQSWPRGCCAALELLLRCPAPACEPVTTLQELLLDDMWEALKVLPLLESRETARAVTAAVVSSQKRVRLWQEAAATVLLGSPAAAAAATAAAAAVQGVGQGEEKKKGSSKAAGKGAKGSSSSGKALRPAPAAADASGEAGSSKSGATAEVAAPAWLLAAAEADPQAALRAGLGLLYRLLDCAQKAYYWRWYTWWQQLQQHTVSNKADDPAAALSSSSTASSAADDMCGSSSVWSNSSSFLSSSSEDSQDDDDDANGVNDDDVNAAIEAASSVGSSTDSMSSCCAQLVARRAAAAAAAATAAAAAAEDASDATLMAAPAAAASGDLWCEGAVQLAFGYSALAAPCFQFVDAVVKGGFAGLPESQRLQQQEVLLGLLDNVSAGLASNSLILVELQRLGLLPCFGPGAAAAVSQLSGCLTSMLAAALKAGPSANKAACALPAGCKASSVKSAASGTSKSKLTPPAPAAPLEVYDAWWQGLGFEPLAQLRLSAALAGLAQQPVAVAAVGCHNPGCSNLAGLSERRLATLACRACRQVAYCCRSCQASHWKAEGYCHRSECADLQEQQAAEWLPVEPEEGEEGSCETCV
uniref:MYND-type domain-containing protein n=1 Tax=Tetradesmus obliquus TaxID=3088 RepID=A0A383W5G9_TETOB|eukprot:jgi/Sobl393_1/14084/SZX72887.1